MRFTLSPIYSLFFGHFLTGIIAICFYIFGMYENNPYFQWGPPVVFFNFLINSSQTFYLLLFITFIHQLVTNWIAEVVYPWIINTIQNPKNDSLDYSKTTCLAIINFHSLYNQLHLAFIIGSVTSQFSFLVILICADIITLTCINNHYIRNKTVNHIPEKKDETVNLDVISSQDIV
jgi:hypothetical protein